MPPVLNKRTWNKLPEDLQEILRVAMRTAAYDMYTQATHESGKNWVSMKAEYPDVQVKDFPPEVMQAMRDANARLLAEHAEKDALAKEIQQSQADYLKQVRSWTDISHRAYLNNQANQ